MASTPRWTAVLASLVTLSVVADGFGVVAALPSVGATFHAAPAATGWVVALHLLTLAVLAPAGGRLADRLGHRRILAAGLLASAAGSAACAAAPSLDWLDAARVAQGAGSALAVAAARGQWRAVRALWGPPGTAGCLAPAAGLVLAPPAVGSLVAGLGWRWLFAADAGLGLAAAMLARLMTAESRGPRRARGWDGVVLSAVGAGGVAWAAHRRASGWPPDAVAALVLGCAAVALAVRWETPLGGRHARAYLSSHAASAFLAASVSGSAFLGVWRLHADGSDPSAVTEVLSLWALATGAVAGALIVHRHRDGRDRRPRRGLAAPGLLLHAAGLGLLALLAPHGVDRAAALAPVVVSGVGCGMAVAGRAPGPPAARDAPRTPRAADAGPPIVTTGAVCAGGALGVALVAGVSPGRPGGAAWPTAHGAAVWLLGGALLAAVGWAASLAVPGGPGTDAVDSGL